MQAHIACMLIVSSLAGAQGAFATHAPARVISLLSQDETAPHFDGLAPANHLHLYIERDACSATISNAAKARAEEIIQFTTDFDGAGGDILIHCNRGISRSMAAAYIIQCAMNAGKDEEALALALRRAAPHADPCPMMIAHADDILDRDGRMLDAIQDLAPPCADITAPPVTLPLAS